MELTSWELVITFCHRDLKVSNLLMTDKGCVKTGGCRALALWEVWPLGQGSRSVLTSTLKAEGWLPHSSSLALPR